MANSIAVEKFYHRRTAVPRSSLSLPALGFFLSIPAVPVGFRLSQADMKCHPEGAGRTP